MGQKPSPKGPPSRSKEQKLPRLTNWVSNSEQKVNTLLVFEAVKLVYLSWWHQPLVGWTPTQPGVTALVVPSVSSYLTSWTWQDRQPASLCMEGFSEQIWRGRERSGGATCGPALAASPHWDSTVSSGLVRYGCQTGLDGLDGLSSSAGERETVERSIGRRRGGACRHVQHALSEPDAAVSVCECVVQTFELPGRGVLGSCARRNGRINPGSQGVRA